ncbi:hypothetical protein OESDEN_24840 [Oesophagostomum dentatum]|uniref:ET module n=1 Tax=Oesophagostomum dentatum TaxID=61180 RepID=A0A0B1RSC5_OESDE|nr:hypothetical protein OESDEN_24840 [Oesophagostomum dentatum]
MPIDVGNSTLYLCDVYDMCKGEGCIKDSLGRETCCCSMDLCNNAYGYGLIYGTALMAAFRQFLV